MNIGEAFQEHILNELVGHVDHLLMVLRHNDRTEDLEAVTRKFYEVAHAKNHTNLNKMSFPVCRALVEIQANNEEVDQLLKEIDAGWKVEDGVYISRRFGFSSFDLVMEFDHHPDVQFGYGYCVVKYTTHDSGGLTIKDFQCAKRIDEL